MRKMTRRESAENNFIEGYNCCQAVVLAFSDLLPVDRESLLKISSSFGGGIGRLRETCGAVSGIAIVLGLLYGYASPETGSVKADHYARIQEVILDFEKKNGSLVCRDLLNLADKHSTPEPSPRTADFYGKRPCQRYIGDAAELLELYLSK